MRLWPRWTARALQLQGASLRQTAREVARREDLTRCWSLVDQASQQAHLDAVRRLPRIDFPALESDLVKAHDGFMAAVSQIPILLNTQVLENSEALAPRLARFLDDWRQAFVSELGLIPHYQFSALELEVLHVTVSNGHVDHWRNLFGMSREEIIYYLMEGAIGPEFRGAQERGFRSPHRIVLHLGATANVQVQLVPVDRSASLAEALEQLDGQHPVVQGTGPRLLTCLTFEVNGLNGLPADAWRLRNINNAIGTI